MRSEPAEPPRVPRRLDYLSPATKGALLCIVHRYEFCRQNVAERRVEPAVVEPVDPVQRASSTASTLRQGPFRCQNFSKGGTINSTAEALRSGELQPGQLPVIRVVEHEGQLVTLDNRRLAAFAAADVKEMPVQVVSLGDPALMTFARALQELLVVAADRSCTVEVLAD